MTRDWLKQNKVDIFEWPSSNPDLNATKILWKDLKWAVHVRKSAMVPELKLFCKEQ